MELNGNLAYSPVTQKIMDLKPISVGNQYGRGGNIDHAYRIAPRVVFKPGKMRFAVEVENTVAAYGAME